MQRKSATWFITVWRRMWVRAHAAEQPIDQGQIDDWSPSVHIGSGISLSLPATSARSRATLSIPARPPELEELAHHSLPDRRTARRDITSASLRGPRISTLGAQEHPQWRQLHESASSSVARARSSRCALLAPARRRRGFGRDVARASSENNQAKGPLPMSWLSELLDCRCAPTNKACRLLWDRSVLSTPRPDWSGPLLRVPRPASASPSPAQSPKRSARPPGLSRFRQRTATRWRHAAATSPLGPADHADRSATHRDVRHAQAHGGG